MDGKIVTTFNVGRPVEVMDKSGDWSEVRVQENGKYVYGYMILSITRISPSRKNSSIRFNSGRFIFFPEVFSVKNFSMPYCSIIMS